jgi:predicted helicase
LIKPDAKQNWINLTDNDFDSFIPIASKKTKAAKTKGAERAIFKLLSNGIVSARDEWTIGFAPAEVAKKVKKFCQVYRSEQARWLTSSERKDQKTERQRVIVLRNFVSREIKWTEELEAHLDKGTQIKFFESRLKLGADRPFVILPTYFARVITHRVYRQDLIFQIGADWNNTAIGFSGVASTKPFQSLAINKVPSFDLLEKTQFVPRYRYEHGETPLDNITDWALVQFRAHYETGNAKPKRLITKDAIFHYVYAVLHDSAYREKYAQNLKREFPRIPFYLDFWAWFDWGAELMRLHIGYECVEPWPLARTDTKDQKAAAAGLAPKTILRADKEHGIIVLDSETQLSGVPKEAWDYRLGNRSALEWILDQYKEKTPKDPTIRAKFNTYRFADYKEKVVDLIARVTRVSVETHRIVEAMKGAAR